MLSNSGHSSSCTYIKVSLLSPNLRMVIRQLSLVFEHIVQVTIPESLGDAGCDDNKINSIIIILLIIMLVHNVPPTYRYYGYQYV